METIAMRTKDLAVIVTMAVAAGAGIAYSVKERTALLLPATVRRLGGHAICAVPGLRKRHGTPRHQARSGDDGLTDTGRADVTSHSTSHQGTRYSRRGALGGRRGWCSLTLRR